MKTPIKTGPLEFDVVAFGEGMVRLSPPNFERVEQTKTFEVFTGGAEMNLAVAMSRLGLKTTFVTRFSDNCMGHLIRNSVRTHGVNVDYIDWTNEGRVGVYIMEWGASPRPSKCTYDRTGSAISLLKPGMIDWDDIFEKSRHFHTSGITPALSQSCAEATIEACKAAKRHNVTVSIDLNYRAKLWSEADAGKVMTELMDYTDILITTEEDTKRVLKITGDEYEDVARKLDDRWGFNVVAITLRENLTIWTNNWSAMVYVDGKAYQSKKYFVEIVDRLGGGDSFASGFLSRYLRGDDIEYATEYGVAFSALKHSIRGDFNLTLDDEVQKLLKGGRIRVDR